MAIVSGPASNGIGGRLAGILGVSNIEVKHRIFPDGESYINIPDIDDDEAVVVQSTYYPQDKHLMELLFIADELRRRGIEKITAVVPYLAYARQNRDFSRGDATSINTVMEAFHCVGIRSLVVVEPHKKEVVKPFRGKSAIVSISKSLVKELEKRVKDPFVLSPDEGGLDRAVEMAALLNCEYDHVEKERNKSTGKLSAENLRNTEIRGREVIIIDDMISTGGTVAQAAGIAKKNGASRIIVAAAHLLMDDGAYERIGKAGVVEVYGANTIPNGKARQVDISEDVAEALTEMQK